jgi:hypothetical protein
MRQIPYRKSLILRERNPESVPRFDSVPATGMLEGWNTGMPGGRDGGAAEDTLVFAPKIQTATRRGRLPRKTVFLGRKSRQPRATCHTHRHPGPKNRVFRGASPEYQNTRNHMSQSGILDFSPKNAIPGDAPGIASSRPAAPGNWVCFAGLLTTERAPKRGIVRLGTQTRRARRMKSRSCLSRSPKPPL